ncbi:putative glycoside hydrolase [Patescibacteria group bacterium]|nr:putative glycoside hydrolase [Patescibacteria group bacterium]
MPPHTRMLALIGGIVALSFGVGVFVLPSLTPTRYETDAARVAGASSSTAVVEEKNMNDEREVVRHVPLPSAVKTIYMTSCVVGTPSFRKDLVDLIDRTEINSVIIDIKDYSGEISFPAQSEILAPAWAASKCGTSDMKAFIASLHEKDIYVIGRISVFQDPLQTKMRPDLAVKKASDGSVWKDGKGLSFVDVSAKDHWEYILTLATDSYNIGFDELNFDYVRFPTDGNMKDIAFTHTGAKSKPEALELFFAYLHSELSKPERFASVRHENTGRENPIPYTSADLFGMTTSNTDDLSIGQVLERALPYFDFIAPMVYPSHYPKTFIGLADPNSDPYKVIQYAMSEGVRRTIASTTMVDGFKHERIGTSTPALYSKPVYDKQKLRPWLQDFDYGGDYGPAEVRAQIQATYDTGLTSWMLWAPSNRYTEGALESGMQ